MHFSVNIHTDNEAFDPDASPELARILRKIADTVESGEPYDTFQTIFDVNGNDVGRFAIKPEDSATSKGWWSK